MKRPDRLKTIPVDWILMLALFAVVIFVPRAMIAVCPVYVAAQVFLFPDRFRGHSGSLLMAICLVTAMCVSSGIIITLSLIHGDWPL